MLNYKFVLFRLKRQYLRIFLAVYPYTYVSAYVDTYVLAKSAV